MNGFLLDTNVVSELTKDAPDPRVVAFLVAQDDLWLSVIVLHELAFGLNLLPPGRRHDRIDTVLSEMIAAYEDRVLPVDRSQAEQAAALRARAHRLGRVLGLADALHRRNRQGPRSFGCDQECSRFRRSRCQCYQSVGNIVSSITESVVEDAALAWLESLGWRIAHGPDIAPDTPGAERTDYGDVVLGRAAPRCAGSTQSRTSRYPA